MACHFTKILLKCNFTQTMGLEEHKINIKIRLRMKGRIIFLFSLYFTSISLFVFLCCFHTDSCFASPLFFYYLVFIVQCNWRYCYIFLKKPILNHVSHLSLSGEDLFLLHMQKHAKKNPNMLVDFPSFFHFLTREG